MKKLKVSPEKNVKPMPRAIIGLVIAPAIPTTELKALKKHFKESLKDPEYTLVTNYEVRTDILTYDPKRENATVVAPDIPVDEVMLLRAKFDRAVARSLRTKKASYIFVNYEMRIDVGGRIPGNIIN